MWGIWPTWMLCHSYHLLLGHCHEVLLSKVGSAADGHLSHWGKSLLVHTLLVLSQSLSLTSKVRTPAVGACVFSHCSENIMLCPGGWVPRGLSPSWAGAALGQEPARFPLASLQVVFTKQRQSGSEFTFYVCPFTEKQNLLPGVQNRPGQSTQQGSNPAYGQPWRAQAPPPGPTPPRREPSSSPEGHGLLTI